MIHHKSFWTEARRTGGIFLHDDNNGALNEAAKEKAIKDDAAEKEPGKENVSETAAARKNMLNFLEQLRQKGVKLFVDGRTALPGEIASKAVCEDSIYMADYVLGETGAIEQVRFDKVTGQ